MDNIFTSVSDISPTLTMKIINKGELVLLLSLRSLVLTKNNILLVLAVILHTLDYFPSELLFQNTKNLISIFS